jgi:hypothetical protein
MGELSTAAKITPLVASGDVAAPTCSAWTRSASVSRLRAVDKMAMPATIAPAAMKNGKWMLIAMTSRPAAYGARPPPMNRTKL